MVVYGLADVRREDRLGIGNVVEIYIREEDAEAALADVLLDEPRLELELSIVPIELPNGAVSSSQNARKPLSNSFCSSALFTLFSSATCMASFGDVRVP